MFKYYNIKVIIFIRIYIYIGNIFDVRKRMNKYVYSHYILILFKIS